MKMNRFRAKF